MIINFPGFHSRPGGMKDMEVKRKGWRRWFAWRPVRISDSQIAWLEYVERRDIQYRHWDGYKIWLDYYQGAK